ncbi:MAG: YhdP family protein [Legionellaceae bacterium]|nr:YhdP family protein [Legionellaceae bacterium]
MKSHTKKLKQVSLRILKRCWVPFAILVVSFAIVFTLFRALTPWVKQYKVQVENHLSTLLGQPVAIRDLETSWYWFEPVLKMDQVTVSDKNDHILKLNKLLVGINLWSSLWHWQIKPGVLYVDDVHLTVRQIDHHWEVDGLKPNKQMMTITADAYLPILGWILSQDTTIIKHLSGDIYFEDGSILPLREVNAKVKNSYGHYRIVGNAQLAQDTPTVLSIIADLSVDMSAINQVSGHAYVSAQNFLLAQWQRFFPQIPYQVKHGECDLQTWVDIEQGHLSGVQSVIHLKDLVWVENGQLKERKIDLLQGNLAWRTFRDGWRLTADKVNLQVGGVTWPENTLQLDYKRSEEAYRVFVKTLLLDSLFAADIAWPESMQTALAMQPIGELHDTQITIKQNQVDYVLTRFANLGWQEKNNIPAVNQISGVLHWQPTEGRLILDGEHTTIKPKNLPPLTFDLLNADMDWKELNNGFRMSLDRFVLSHPNLLLSATGALDNPSSPDGNLRLTAEFAAKNANKLLNYIPSVYLKPKLDAWLKHDVQRIERASGRVIVNGKLADFPYDSQPGEFSIVSHVSGVDIAINSKWPLNRDIDADLVVDKRSLVANVDQANLHGVSVDKINLVVNGIGLGREALLLHGEFKAPGEQVKSYVFATPLRERLTRWQALDISDSLGLDLRLEVPLYPESDHVIALGEMTFDNNPVTVNLPVVRVKLNDVTGALQFNEYGLTDGGLKGTLAGYPIAMHAQSIIEPKEGTVLSIEGETSMDYLQKLIGSPVLNVLSGHFNLTGLWTIYPGDKDPDQLHLDSSLEGVAIDVPEPLGKASTEIAPLTVDVVFNLKSAMGVRINYDNRLSSELLLTPVNKHLTLNKGELRLGKGQATLPKHAGLTISGSLPDVDLSKWHAVLDELPDNGASLPIMDSVHAVALNVGRLLFFGQSYENMVFKATKLSKNDWSLTIDQKNIAADLHYQPTNHLISGVIGHLYLNHLNDTEHNHQVSKWNPQPLDIPNLNLTIDALKVHDVDVGSVNLKSTSSKTDWLLSYCNITSPDYQLNVQGNWKQIEKKNSSTMQAQLRLIDLGKSLERWHLTPAVYAHPGNVTFEGGWPGRFYDFALNRVSGKMQIVLKNGRISHFDKETEEKLGLGKLLSILSLQTIPRRLKLDFSDLSEQGYSFDIFKGNFQLNQGVMSTSDSYIDGPVAYARMEGDLDLSKRLYDVNLRITPYITASLPVVATIAGGPIAGLATWVASNIINKGMQKISGYTYKVSGPWLDPVVQQVSIDRSAH